MTKIKKKKFKTGKCRRQQFRKKLNQVKGFAAKLTSPAADFRVEFNFEDEHGNESNEQTHWIQCRIFRGEERRFIQAYYADKDWSDRETLESKFVAVYVAQYLSRHHKEIKLNQAFIYHAPKQNNETIRVPIYQLKLSDKWKTHIDDKGIEAVLKRAIAHTKPDLNLVA